MSAIWCPTCFILAFCTLIPLNIVPLAKPNVNAPIKAAIVLSSSTYNAEATAPIAAALAILLPEGLPALLIMSISGRITLKSSGFLGGAL